MTDESDSLENGWIELLGAGAREFENSLENAELSRIMERIWKRDRSLWKGNCELIGNRLGWLSLPENTARSLPEINKFAERLRAAGIRDIVLIAMGGSALMSKVFGKAFSPPGSARLTVLDTTVPDTIAEVCGKIDFTKTFFIVSSKSGGTIETVSVADFFFEKCRDKIGDRKTAEQFAAITDPGTPLCEISEKRGFTVFAGDETVGGRFSPLSLFGMIPGSAIGANAEKILSSAAAMAGKLGSGNASGANPNTALRLAAAVDFFCKKGGGAFHLRCSKAIEGFDRFIEQIVGESLGKEGRSVLPVAHPFSGDEKSPGTFFVCLKNDTELISHARKTAAGGTPVVMTLLEDTNALGGEIFRWEMAVAVLGALWEVNPFDQPDVESAKSQTRRFMKIRREKGGLPFSKPDFKHGDIEFRTSDSLRNAGELRSYFEKNAGERKKEGYFSIQAFLNSSDKKMSEALESFRYSLSKAFGVTVTADWGPCYLHSSGQIHKGDRGNGFFIQMSGKCRSGIRVPPDTPESGGAPFEALKEAQMLGDREALESRGRKVVQIKFVSEVENGISEVAKLLGLR